MSFDHLSIRPSNGNQPSFRPSKFVQSPFTDPVRSVHNPYKIPRLSTPPPIASGWGSFHEAVKPVKFLPEKGFTNTYIDLSPRNDFHKELAQKHIRYAQFLKRHNSDHKPYESIPSAFIVKNIGGNLSVKTPGSHVEADSETVRMAKQIHFKLFELGLTCNENGYYSDAKTGTVLRLVIDPASKEICVSFYGLRMGDDETRNKVYGKNVLAGFREFIGDVPDAALQAAQIGALMKSIAEEKGYEAVMLGHSHGGGLAQVAALANGLKGVVFNARPMGAGVRRRYKDQIQQNAEKIVSFSGKGDWLGGNRVFNAIARFLEQIGISAPRTIGYGYNLPEAPGMERFQGAVRMNYQHNKYLKQLRQIAGDHP